MFNRQKDEANKKTEDLVSEQIKAIDEVKKEELKPNQLDLFFGERYHLIQILPQTGGGLDKFRILEEILDMITISSDELYAVDFGSVCSECNTKITLGQVICSNCGVSAVKSSYVRWNPEKDTAKRVTLNNPQINSIKTTIEALGKADKLDFAYRDLYKRILELKGA